MQGSVKYDLEKIFIKYEKDNACKVENKLEVIGRIRKCFKFSNDCWYIADNKITLNFHDNTLQALNPSKPPIQT